MASAVQVLGVIQDKIINLNAKFTQLRYLAKWWRCRLGQSFHVNLGHLLLDIGRSVKRTTTTVYLHCLLGPIWGRFEVTLRPISDGQNILLAPSERRSEIARTSFHFKTKKTLNNIFLSSSTKFYISIDGQCDQIRRFLKVPTKTFVFKGSPNVQWRFGQFWKASIFKKKLLWLLFGQFMDFWGYFLFQHLVTLISAPPRINYRGTFNWERFDDASVTRLGDLW